MNTVCAECGALFTYGNGYSVENACSLACWTDANVRRASAESNQWDGCGGYFRDPRQYHPEFYAYKGWQPLEGTANKAYRGAVTVGLMPYYEQNRRNRANVLSAALWGLCA